MPVLVEMLSLVAPAGTLRTVVGADGSSLAHDGVLETVSFRSHDEIDLALATLEGEGHATRACSSASGRPGSMASG